MPALRRVAERPGKYAKPMIDALISGKLHAHPEQRTSKTGKTYATAKMTAAGGDGQSLFVNCIAFDEASVEALLALVAGGNGVALLPAGACHLLPAGITLVTVTGEGAQWQVGVAWNPQVVDAVRDRFIAMVCRKNGEIPPR